MNVLLAIDYSPCAQAAVEAVRDGFPRGTTVRVAHVVEWPHDAPVSVTFAQGRKAAECVLAAHEQLRERAHALVAHAAARLAEAGFDATTCVAEGSPRDEILRIAAAWPADTIVIGSHGRKGLDRLLLGSVSESLARRAPCSVEVVREPGGAVATAVATREG